MCDIYHAKCECCNEKLCWHIGDFLFPRSAFKMWCGSHIKKAPDDAIVFKISNGGNYTRYWAVAGPVLNTDNHPNELYANIIMGYKKDFAKNK